VKKDENRKEAGDKSESIQYPIVYLIFLLWKQYVFKNLYFLVKLWRSTGVFHLG
jgi:hypothetical protein